MRFIPIRSMTSSGLFNAGWKRRTHMVWATSNPFATDLVRSVADEEENLDFREMCNRGELIPPKVLGRLLISALENEAPSMVLGSSGTLKSLKIDSAERAVGALVQLSLTADALDERLTKVGFVAKHDAEASINRVNALVTPILAKLSRFMPEVHV
ncbi:MAG: hypothetical protein GY822_31110 [Deltaproteobacteria bacterium]|nr:hypothetical protein [Deltaproteobacteria bacterium]